MPFPSPATPSGDAERRLVLTTPDLLEQIAEEVCAPVPAYLAVRAHDRYGRLHDRNGDRLAPASDTGSAFPMSLVCRLFHDAVRHVTSRVGGKMVTTSAYAMATTPSLMTWALDQGCPRTVGTLYDAGRAGNEDVARLLGERRWTWVNACMGGRGGPQWSVWAWRYAARHLLAGAAAEGHLSLMQSIIGKWPPQCSAAWPPQWADAIAAAAENGHVEVLEWMCAFGVPVRNDEDDGYRLGPDAVRAAAEGGQLGVLQWLHERRSVACAIQHAARRGDMHILRWFKDEGIFDQDGERRLHLDDVLFDAFLSAVSSDRRDAVEWLREAYPEQEATWDVSSLVMDAAAHAGNLVMMQSLVERGGALTAWTCHGAAKGNNVEVLTWLRDWGCHWDNETFRVAAEHGAVDALALLYDTVRPVEWGEVGARVSISDIDGLQFAKEKGGVLFDDDKELRLGLVEAADFGKLHVLQWFFEHGAALCADPLLLHASDTDSIKAAVSRRAAAGGHLPILEWAHAAGFPFDTRVCVGAAGNGRLDVLRWLVDRGCACDAHAFRAAAFRGHLDVVEWLHRGGFQTSYSGSLVGFESHVKKWILENRSRDEGTKRLNEVPRSMQK